MLSDGKRFERNFRDSCKEQGIWTMRIKDTFVKAKELDKDAFVPCQACDYLLHYGPYVYLCELKTTDKKYISIEREAGQHGMIHYTQWTQMRDAVGDAERAALVLQFQRGTDDQATYWMPLQGFLSFLETSDKKSINRLDVVQYGGEPIKQNKIKINYNYDVKKVLDNLKKALT